MPPAVNAEGSRPSGGDGGRSCRRCGTVAAERDHRCRTCSSFLPGNRPVNAFTARNTAAQTHGVRAFETAGRLDPELRQSVDEFRDGLISDQGGLEGLTTVRAGLIRALVHVEAVRRILFRDLVERGMFTPTGSPRATHDRFMATLDRWVKLADRLGVERRPRQLDTLDLADYQGEATPGGPA